MPLQRIKIAFVPLHFVFDGAWEGLHKVVQITQCCETYNLILGTEGKSCLLPSECKAGTMKLSVFGYAPSDTQALRATTIPVQCQQLKRYWHLSRIKNQTRFQRK